MTHGRPGTFHKAVHEPASGHAVADRNSPRTICWPCSLFDSPALPRLAVASRPRAHSCSTELGSQTATTEREDTMRIATATTTSRAVTISRLVVLLTVALLLGSVLVPSVDATKVSPKTTVASVKKRVQGQKDICEIGGGGTLTVTNTAFGSTVTKCNGGTDVHTKKKTTCHSIFAPPPRSVEETVTAPLGDAGVSDEPGDGGINAGGAAVPPGEGAGAIHDPPADGPITSFDGQPTAHAADNRQSESRCSMANPPRMSLTTNNPTRAITTRASSGGTANRVRNKRCAWRKRASWASHAVRSAAGSPTCQQANTSSRVTASQ